eukprot:3158348-Pleurochrysis_carterae.AAC.1
MTTPSFSTSTTVSSRPTSNPSASSTPTTCAQTAACLSLGAPRFAWISKQKTKHSSSRMDWSYYCSCHGKGECDGEGGTVKNAADKYEFGGDASGKRVSAKIQGPEEFVHWSRHGHGGGECLATPKRDVVTKLRSGTEEIFCLFAHCSRQGPNCCQPSHPSCGDSRPV